MNYSKRYGGRLEIFTPLVYNSYSDGLQLFKFNAEMLQWWLDDSKNYKGQDALTHSVSHSAAMRFWQTSWNLLSPRKDATATAREKIKQRKKNCPSLM